MPTVLLNLHINQSIKCRLHSQVWLQRISNTPPPPISRLGCTLSQAAIHSYLALVVLSDKLLFAQLSPCLYTLTDGYLPISSLQVVFPLVSLYTSCSASLNVFLNGVVSYILSCKIFYLSLMFHQLSFHRRTL